MLKESLLHLPVLLLIFLMVFGLTLALSLLASWTVIYNPVFPLEPGWTAKQLSVSAGKVLIASIFIALYLVFFRIRKRPGNRLFSFLLPLVASFIISVTGVTVVYGPPGSPLPREYETLKPFTPGLIHDTETGLVYVDKVSAPADSGAESLENIVLYAEKDMRHIGRASVVVRDTDDLKSAVILPAVDTEEPVIVRPANPVYEPIFEAPQFLASLVDDIATLERFLLETRAKSPGGFSLALFSVLLAVTGCIFFSRATRWPLFNAILTLAAFRGSLYILRFLESDIGVEVRNMISNTNVHQIFFTLVFLGIGVLLTAMNFVFPGKRHG